jgi:hypothetical protein
MADDKDTTGTTTTTTGGIFDTVKSTVEGLFTNEYVKLGAVGVGGFVAGYVTRLIQGWFSKKA